jgi:hypothetical protein
MFEFRGRASASPIHGGLTPAALAGCAFVHRKNRFLTGGRPHTQYKSGGRQPPVAMFSECEPETAIRRIAIADAVCNPTAG